MAAPAGAQIYLADARGCSETTAGRSYHTFNDGAYQADDRQPFGALHRLNDHELEAGACLTTSVTEPITILLLPVTGGLEYNCPLASGFLEPGQAGCFGLEAGMSYTVSNPYPSEEINFLQIGLAVSLPESLPTFNQVSFNLSQKNTLLPLLDDRISYQTEYRVFIGGYDGRQEGTYFVQAGEKPGAIFVFVLQGAFEAANRLLHERDGLSLSYVQAAVLDVEALSNEAILLLIDLAVTR